jgi:hypothetical protein
MITGNKKKKASHTFSGKLLHFFFYKKPLLLLKVVRHSVHCLYVSDFRRHGQSINKPGLIEERRAKASFPP